MIGIWLQKAGRKVLFAVVGLLLLFSESAFAQEWSTSQVVSSVEVVHETGGNAAYYLFSASGWGASGCPSATSAYIYSDYAGAQEILALAMDSKRLNKNVQIWGTCSSGYFFITALYLAA